MNLVFPRLYAIIDPTLLTISELELAEALAGSGVELIQYRHKTASSRQFFEISRAVTNPSVHHVGKLQLRECKARLDPVEATDEIRRIVFRDGDVAVMSTFDSSSAPDWIAPAPLVFG